MSEPSSNRATRDRIEQAIADLSAIDRWSVLRGDDSSTHRRTLAGVLRKAFAPELVRMRNTEETLSRVRRLVRQYPEDESVPVRRLLAALYGEDQP